MIIGKHNKLIELWKPVSEDDDQGGRIDTMTLEQSVWAEFKRPRFSNSEFQGTPATVITQGISIRDIAGIRRGWDVHYGSVVYHVIDVDRTEPGEALLTCMEAEK